MNYERMIYRFPDSFINSFRIRLSAGPWIAWLNKGTNFDAVAAAVFGRRNIHPESGFGILYTWDPVERRFDPIVRDRHLAGNFGFRFQKPEGKFIFRTGIGWPEGIYLSLGYCF